MNIEVMAFDEGLKPLSVHAVETDDHNHAAKSAGFAVETFLRRKDVKYIIVKREKE